MTWPAGYGGSERSNFDRLVVTEELLAAGASSAHWIADNKVVRYSSGLAPKNKDENIYPGYAEVKVIFL